VDPARPPDPGRVAADLANHSRSLAIGWVATLGLRPFQPSNEQLAWVDGGDLVEGEAHDRRMRVAATRYAGLLADHIAGDVTVDGGPGAYAMVWLCARQAFIDNFMSGEAQSLTRHRSDPPAAR
jgi:hypothetical protein